MIGMAIQLLWVLFFIGVAVAVVYVVLWFLQSVLQLPLPQQAIRIIWGLLALLCIIWLLMWLSGAGPIPFPSRG